MLVLASAATIAMLSGFLLCLKRDHQPAYLVIRRLVYGLMTAVAAATTWVYILVALIGCNDVDKYSALWYAMGCWYWEHSS